MSQVRESVADTCSGTSLADILQSALPADSNHQPPNTQPSTTSSGTNSFNSDSSKSNNVSTNRE